MVCSKESDLGISLCKSCYDIQFLAPKFTHWWICNLRSKLKFLAVGLWLMAKNEKLKKSSPKPKAIKVNLSFLQFNLQKVFKTMLNFSKILRRPNLMPQKMVLQNTNNQGQGKLVYFAKKSTTSTKACFLSAVFSKLWKPKIPRGPFL